MDSQTPDYADYMSDTELSPTPILPTLDTTLSTAIIVTNLPKIGTEKCEKLLKMVVKMCTKFAVVDEVNSPLMPFDEVKKLSLGFAFLNFSKASDAKLVVEKIHGFQLDKVHKLSAFPYDDIRALSSIPSTYTEPSAPKQPVSIDSAEWLKDEMQRDEFCVRHGNETEVYWTDGLREPTLDYAGEREKAQGVQWCNYYMQWSPKGSYMATIVPSKGVIVWGGGKFEKMQRFAHADVNDVSFSPDEKYMMTNNYNAEVKDAVKIFEVKTGKLLRAFALFPDNITPVEDQVAPPFQWSFDDSYIARQGEDMITIYELPSMKLLQKRSLNADGIYEFQWSPNGNIISYWAPEKGNAPAHVDLIEIPSRKQLRQKNLFNVTKCSMSWQSEGAYLGVKVLRHTKSKKTLYNNFELFRVHEAGIPVEMLDIKDAVMAFGWEPSGTRFALVHAESISSTRTNVSFYNMNKLVESEKKVNKKMIKETATVHELNLVETLAERQCNELYWSPAGGVIVLAGLGDNASGSLEFYDVDAKERMAMREHYRATQVVWDPSGRTLTTCVIQPIQGGYFKFQMDNGYMLWSFQGKQLHTQSFENFYQFAWRPRKSLLSEEKKEEVVRNLKKYEKKFDKMDKEKTRLLYLEETKEKRGLRSDFRERIAGLKDFVARQKRDRIELDGGYDSDDERNFSFKTVVKETVVSTAETTVDRW